jgi:hypothetical protein
LAALPTNRDRSNTPTNGPLGTRAERACPVFSAEMRSISGEAAKAATGGTLGYMFLTYTTSAALRAFGQPRALTERIPFAVQLVSPAQAGAGAGACRGGRSTHRST